MYVIQVTCPDKGAFYAYAYIMYIHSRYICRIEPYIRIQYKPLYVYAPALEAAASTVVMVWLLARWRESCLVNRR
jgi:hypothetical protein